MEKNNATTKKVVYIAISVFIAMFAWFSVDNSNGTQATIEVNNILIEYEGADTILAERGLMLLEDSDQTVSLELRGKRSLITKLDPDDVRIQANLTEITSVGQQSISYYVVYPSSEFNTNSIAVVDQSAYTVMVNIGELYSKEIPVRYEIEGSVADGYNAGAVVTEPATVEVRGQQELIDQVSYAKVHFVIDDATQTVVQTLQYDYYDVDNNLIDGSELRASVDEIQVTMPVYITKELSLIVNFTEDVGARLENVRYSISPATITVSGEADKLEDIDSIFLGTFDLLTLEGKTTYNYVIDIPEGCENLSGSTRALMDISFTDMQNATVLTSNYILENMPEEKVATILTSELAVRIFGTAEDVGAVTAENLEILVNMDEFTAASGTYTVPVEVRFTTDGDVGLLGTYQVRVTISDPPEEPEDTQTEEDDQEGEKQDDTSGDSGENP